MTSLRYFSVVLLGCALGSAACSRDEVRDPLLDLAEAAGVTQAAVHPRIGGQPVLAGAHVIEVLPRADGTIEADVRDANGDPLARAALRVSLGGDAPVAVPLRYDAELGRYRGRAPRGAQLVEGPVEVELRPRGGEPVVGRAPMISVAPMPVHGGQVVLTGPVAPEARLGADGTVRAYVPTEDGRLSEGKLYARVPVHDRDPVRVTLAYDDEEGGYVGELDDDLVVAPGPFELEIEAGKVVYRGRVADVVIAPRATFGGEILLAGDYGVEVAPVEGELRAVLYDRHGRPVTDRPPAIMVRAEGHPRPVRLVWNTQGGYYAAASPPNVVVRATPLHVEVRHRGRLHRGGLRVHPHPARARVEVVPPAARVEVEMHRPGLVVHVDDGPHYRHGKHRKYKHAKHRKYKHAKHRKYRKRGKHKKHKKGRYR